MRLRHRLLIAATAVIPAVAALGTAGSTAITQAAPATHAVHLPAVHPTVAEWAQVNQSETPPTEEQCFSVGRRCFTPAATRAAYNIGPLYGRGFDGSGKTIAIVDSYGSDTIRHDLHVYNQAFSLPPMCGEEGVECASGMPT